jgi:hypothetical protein
VPGEDSPNDAVLDEASVKLSEGLKVCRSVIDNYRSMLSGESASTDKGDGQPDTPEDPASINSD